LPAVSAADAKGSKPSRPTADFTLGVGATLGEPPSSRLIQAAFADELQAQHELFAGLGLADLAHTLTMADSGVIPKNQARELAAWLLKLQERPADFTPEPGLGDLYTNREAWLAARTQAAGWLGVARARREAATCAFYLLLRERLLVLGEALAQTADALAERAERHRQDLMPAYTYLQAGQPTTFGHYLLGFAWPILRDLGRIQDLYRRVNCSPAGCGGGTGSLIRQDREALARRLGFDRPIRHARDAMWQTDVPIESLSVLTAVAVNLDRLAEDLMVFATAEFGFVRLADRHARASKIMPQKRNPFALAHVRAVANRLLGIQTAVGASGRTPSGQVDNRINIYGAVPQAAAECAEAAALMAEVLNELAFDGARAERALADRSTCAADLAERLTTEKDLDFRTAHAVVGRLVRRLEDEGRSLAQATAADVAKAGADLLGRPLVVPDELLAKAIDLRASVAARAGTGGCAPDEVIAMVGDLTERLAVYRSWIGAAYSGQKNAVEALLTEARNYAGAGQ
jgi:argininosuccinate lyase